LGSLQRSPDSLAVFKGPTSKGREGKGRGREGKKEGGTRWVGRGELPPPKLRSLDQSVLSGIFEALDRVDSAALSL